jgi:hypothetical protein
VKNTMKLFIQSLALTLLMATPFGSAAQASTPTPDKAAPPALVAKSTPASDLLVQLSKDSQADQAVFNVKLQQARSTLDQNLKTLSDQVTVLQTKLKADLDKDKKYKPALDQIAALEKQISDANSKENAAFNADAGPVSQKIGVEKAQIKSLTDVVRKENNFPENAVYSEETQKWSVPDQPKK